MAFHSEEVTIPQVSQIDLSADFQMTDIFSLGHYQRTLPIPNQRQGQRREKTVRGHIKYRKSLNPTFLADSEGPRLLGRGMTVNRSRGGRLPQAFHDRAIRTLNDCNKIIGAQPAGTLGQGSPGFSL